ncbi:MAG: arylsulfatase [Bacteroidota bacterium]
MKKLFLSAIVLLLFLLGCAHHLETSKVKRPNIILIMADDMGFSDIAPYGGEINTPNLSKLAANGIRFTQFYNTARCCPTRASLLTGCYPHQTGIGHMSNSPNRPGGHDYGVPEYRGFLNRNTVTIAEVLKEAGYRTLMTGKWHLGYEKQEQWPRQRGFDNFYGLIPGACNFFKPEPPRGITSGNEPVTITDEDYYTTDAFTDYAIQFITDSQQEETQPFFLYLAYNAPHWPIQAPQEEIDKYKGKYQEGWQQLRLDRYERMKKIGLIAADWELTPPDSRDWDSLNEEKQAEMDLRMAIYAAMIDRMDQNIGRLMDSLQARDLLSNTLVMFLSDNGACAEFDELGSGSAEQLETKKGYVLSYGRAWANASNTPFRKYKHWLHEGGMATPFIVHWPDGIDAQKNGTWIKEYGFLPDVMATCLEVSGASYPEEYQGNLITSLAGKSLTSLFRGEARSIHSEPIFWEHEGNKAVRLGKYKLVQAWKLENEDNWELYDLEKDRTEMHNLASVMPARVEEMKALYETWATENNILPWTEIRQILQQKRQEGK